MLGTVLCQTKQVDHELSLCTPWRYIGRCIALLVLNLGTSHRWVVSFMPHSLYSKGQYPWCSSNLRLGLPQRQSGCFGEEKNRLFLGFINKIVFDIMSMKNMHCFTNEERFCSVYLVSDWMVITSALILWTFWNTVFIKWVHRKLSQEYRSCRVDGCDLFA
jgi:hypothetical protein